MSKIKEFEVEGEDLEWEHSQHDIMLPERCSKCYEEEKQLTLEKRQAEADDADRSEAELADKESEL